MSEIRDIVFDAGRVLVDFDYKDCFRFLAEKGAHFTGVDDFTRRTDLKAYESGRISTECFLDNVCRLLTQKVDRSELVPQWVEIFKPIPEMLVLASKLKADYGVFVLSNTSALHWAYLLSEYSLDRIGMGAMASFEVGALKPEPKIFREAERKFALTPKRTLFIDDIEDNAAGALACGWQAIHHISIEKTLEKMEMVLGRRLS